MNPNALRLTTLVNTAANAIADQLSNDNLALVAAIFTQLGDTLETIAAQRELTSGEKNKSVIV